MADIVNLRTARKRKARLEKQEISAQNRAQFGKTKSERQRQDAEKSLEITKLDGHKRDT